MRELAYLEMPCNRLACVWCVCVCVCVCGVGVYRQYIDYIERHVYACLYTDIFRESEERERRESEVRESEERAK